MKRLLSILLLFPALAFGQFPDVSRITIPPVGGTPSLTATPLSLLNFTSTAGSRGTSNSYGLSGRNLGTNTTAVGPLTGYVFSRDNSTFKDTLTITPTAGSFDKTISVALAAGNSAGTFNGNIANVCAGAGVLTVTVSVTGVTNAAASLSAFPLTLSGFTSTQGFQGPTKTYTLTGSGLGSNNVGIGPLAGYVISTDGSNFGNTGTVVPSSGNVSQIISVALASTNSPASFNGSLANVCSGVTTVNIALTGTTGSATKDSARFQFDTLSGHDQAGWTIVRGDPGKEVKSGIAGNNSTITWSTVSTSTNNWPRFSGINSSTNNGVAGLIPNYALNVLDECVFVGAAAYNTTYPQFTISGLNPASTYTIQLAGGLAGNIPSQGEYRIKGASVSTMQTLTAYNNTSTKLTFSSIAPDGSGNISVYFNTVSGQTVACLSWIIVKQD